MAEQSRRMTDVSKIDREKLRARLSKADAETRAQMQARMSRVLRSYRRHSESVEAVEVPKVATNDATLQSSSPAAPSVSSPTIPEAMPPVEVGGGTWDSSSVRSGTAASEFGGDRVLVDVSEWDEGSLILDSASESDRDDEEIDAARRVWIWGASPVASLRGVLRSLLTRCVEDEDVGMGVVGADRGADTPLSRVSSWDLDGSRSRRSMRSRSSLTPDVMGSGARRATVGGGLAVGEDSPGTTSPRRATEGSPARPLRMQELPMDSEELKEGEMQTEDFEEESIENMTSIDRVEDDEEGGLEEGVLEVGAMPDTPGVGERRRRMLERRRRLREREDEGGERRGEQRERKCARYVLPSPAMLSGRLIRWLRAVDGDAAGKHAVFLSECGDVFEWQVRGRIGPLGVTSKLWTTSAPSSSHPADSSDEENQHNTSRGAVYGAAERISRGSRKAGIALVRGLTMERALRGSLGEVVQVACGPWHAAAVTRLGEVFTWGAGGDGQLGHGEMADEALPRPVGALSSETIRSVSCGWTHTLGVTRRGAVFVWGAVGVERGPVPRRVAVYSVQQREENRGNVLDRVAAVFGMDTGKGKGPEEVVEVGVAKHRCVGSKDEDYIESGRVPQWMESPVVEVRAGDGFSVARDRRGRVWTWGDSTRGQCGTGIGRADVFASPSVVDLPARASSISCGRDHVVVALVDGTCVAWGDDRFGQVTGGRSRSNLHAPNSHLAPVVPTPYLVPVHAIAGVPFTAAKITSVGTGDCHSAAIMITGRIVLWGRNTRGQLGSGEPPIAKHRPTIKTVNEEPRKQKRTSQSTSDGVRRGSSTTRKENFEGVGRDGSTTRKENFEGVGRDGSSTKKDDDNFEGVGRDGSSTKKDDDNFEGVGRDGSSSQKNDDSAVDPSAKHMISSSPNSASISSPREAMRGQETASLWRPMERGWLDPDVVTIAPRGRLVAPGRLRSVGRRCDVILGGTDFTLAIERGPRDVPVVTSASSPTPPSASLPVPSSSASTSDPSMLPTPSAPSGGTVGADSDSRSDGGDTHSFDGESIRSGGHSVRSLRLLDAVEGTYKFVDRRIDFWGIF